MRRASRERKQAVLQDDLRGLRKMLPRTATDEFNCEPGDKEA